jgi:hypothetical protein
MPKGGATMVVPAEVGTTAFQFDFDLFEAQFSRSENSLHIQTRTGEVVLEDFFATGGQSLPSFQMMDGAEVPSAEILAYLNPNLNLSTEADPQPSIRGGGQNGPNCSKGCPVNGGGQNDPNCSRGYPVNGGAKDSKEPVHHAAADLCVFLHMNEYLKTGGAYGSGEHAGINVYFKNDAGERVALNSGDIASCNGKCAGSAASRYSVCTSPYEGWSASWLNLSLDKGHILISLNREGRAALRALQGCRESDNLVDYFKVTVTDTHTGKVFEYTTQVIVPTTPEFNAQEHAALVFAHGTSSAHEPYKVSIHAQGKELHITPNRVNIIRCG